MIPQHKVNDIFTYLVRSHITHKNIIWSFSFHNSRESKTPTNLPNTHFLQFSKFNTEDVISSVLAKQHITVVD